MNFLKKVGKVLVIGALLVLPTIVTMILIAVLDFATDRDEFGSERIDDDPDYF